MPKLLILSDLHLESNAFEPDAQAVSAADVVVLAGDIQPGDGGTHPALALDGRRPLDMLATADGIQAVKDLLTRMEFGVYP